MSASKETGPAREPRTSCDGGRVAGPAQELLEILGAILTTVVVIPTVALLWQPMYQRFQHWITPERYLSWEAKIPSPADVCGMGTGWVFDTVPPQLPAAPSEKRPRQVGE